MLNLTAIPRPSKTGIQCTIETMNNENRDSIFKKKMLKGTVELKTLKKYILILSLVEEYIRTLKICSFQY